MGAHTYGFLSSWRLHVNCVCLLCTECPCVPAGLCLCRCLCACHAGLIDYVVADYCWARAVLLLGPTATSCGLALQIPAAGLFDALLHPGGGGAALPWSRTAVRAGLACTRVRTGLCRKQAM